MILCLQIRYSTTIIGLRFAAISNDIARYTNYFNFTLKKKKIYAVYTHVRHRFWFFTCSNGNSTAWGTNNSVVWSVG
jgi:hypothetical protein